MTALAAWATSPSPAAAAQMPPFLSASVRETLDLWHVALGGVRTGADALNKLQMSGTVAFDTLGAPGLSVHAQIFKTSGESLSARVGDIQTLDSLDAVPVTRLFESWIEKQFGTQERSIAVRAGLLDLNADFDSLQTSSLFVNSSHGIGADLARSGRNGPSIYPASALGVRISAIASRRWTVRVAAFDGVPGDLDRPRAFVSARLSPSDGALIVAQADYHLSDKAKIEAGLWNYTAALPQVAVPENGRDQGLYASIEGPIPGFTKVSGWLRAGLANGQVQSVNKYWGTGLVWQGPIKSRPDDRLGLAIARAEISGQARRASALPAAEMAIEGTYQVKVHDTLAVQPDVQYVLHPAGQSRGRNAVVLGMRIVLTAGYPKKAPAAEASDPTVPPEGPQPTDDGAATVKIS